MEHFQVFDTSEQNLLTASVCRKLTLCKCCCAKCTRIIFLISLKQMPVFKIKTSFWESFSRSDAERLFISFLSFLPVLPLGLFTCFSCHKAGGLATTPRGRLFTLRRTSGGLSWCYRFLWSLCYLFEHTLSSHLCTRLQMEQHTGAALKWISNRKVPESLVKHT